MKNKEKYAERVLTLACYEGSFGVYEKTGEMERCTKMHCTECLFYGKKETCHTSRRKWLESEYIEKPVISKRDRAFLEYIDKKFTYIARTRGGILRLFVVEPRKDGAIWKNAYLSAELKLFTVDFPMVKWEDDKPWLIEDLKKLEVVEEYE